MSELTNVVPDFSTAWQENLQRRFREAKAERRAANKKGKRQREIWTLDCETDPFEKGIVPEPFLWGLYDGARDEYWQYSIVDELVEFIRRKEIVIYAHNGGRFDYHYMKPHFNSDEPIMVIGQRIARFRIGEAELRDSTNLLPIALADFQKMEIDYLLFKRDVRDKPENKKLISLYLHSDCVNLYNIVRDFLTRYGSHLTQAGAAMKYWSKKYGTPAPRQSVARFEQMRPYYYGGRVQCFTHGYAEKKFKVLDINSAYPYAMTFKHPYSTDSIASYTLPKTEAQIQTSLIRLIAISKGALPLRVPDGSLYFPNDAHKGREYLITGWEYLAGLETGTLRPIKIKEVLTFRESVCFADYVAEFYDQRQKAKALGDRAGDIFAKIFLNALYGKFAANPANYSEYIISYRENIGKYQAEGYALNSKWDAERDLLARPLPEGKRRYFNIATAASITGFVRAYLWLAICKCQGVLYCDTDSIAASDTGSLVLGNALGAWKREMNSDIYAIAGKKLYAMHDADWKPGDTDSNGDPKPEWKIACKGVKLTAEEIIRVAKRGKVEYMPEVPTYSVHHELPRFTSRKIVSTYRDISIYPTLATGRKAA